MHQNLTVGQILFNICRDLMGELMPGFHGHLFRHNQMHVDVPDMPGFAGTQLEAGH